jgi:hypothetical protein
MDTTKKPSPKVPWYLWVLSPLLLPAILYGLFERFILSLFFVPYYRIFPDHEASGWDVRGTPHQRQLLEKWRLHYAKIGFMGRIRRALFRRRLKLSA